MVVKSQIILTSVIALHHFNADTGVSKAAGTMNPAQSLIKITYSNPDNSVGEQPEG